MVLTLFVNCDFLDVDLVVSLDPNFSFRVLEGAAVVELLGFEDGVPTFAVVE